MKKTIIGIILIVIGGVICFLCARTTGITGDEKGFIEQAIYVENAVINPENEGKGVMISGQVSHSGDSVDPQLNFGIRSPYVMRTVERYLNKGSFEEPKMEWTIVYTPTADDPMITQNFYGNVRLGDFSISGLFLAKAIELADYNQLQRDIGEAHHLTVETPSKGPQLYTEAEKITNDDNLTAYENAKRISYRYIDPDQLGEMTIVGTQRGSSLVPTDQFIVKAVKGNFNKPEDVIKALQRRSVETTVFGFFVFVICIIIGLVLIYPAFKKRFK